MADAHSDHAGHYADPTFYRSPRDAAAGPPEKLAYVAAFSRPADKPDAIAVIDTDPASASYASVVGFTELPNLGDGFHHFGWNACSSALEPTGEHNHGDRRYLVVPGLRSSRLYILDTLENPAAPEVVKVLGPEELGKRANYSRPHTVHCGPGYLYVSCLGGGDSEGPGGVALLYVSCWGTGELKQYDVSDPARPVETGSVRIGGITGRKAHPARPGQSLAGGPQMVEVSRDGKRVYFSNSLYGAWDDQFYPDGVGSWLTKLDVGEGGGISFDERFFIEGDAWRGRRVHQIRLEGGDASSDSYCYS